MKEKEISTEKNSSNEHSMKNMVSYVMNIMAIQIVGVIFMARLLIFYETNVGLSLTLIGLAYSIFTIWDAFNEPFSGYLSDRPNRLWKRWGKRYPWIIFSVVPISLSFLLIFTPPDPKVNEWLTFFWFLVIISIYDEFYTLWYLNYQSLLPDKFRSDKERHKVSGLRVPFHVGGLLIGLILPSLIIDYKDRTSYVTMAIIVTIMLIILTLLSIPGIREDKLMKERAINTAKQIREPFFKNLKSSFTHKNFRVWIISGIASYAWDALLISSVPYYVQYVLHLEADAEIFIYLAYLLGGVFTAPIWLKLVNKYGHWNIRKITLVLGPIAMFLLMFPNDLLTSIILTAILGIILGGNNVALYPVQADLMDEAAIIHGERHEGRYNGMYVFVSKAGQFIQIITILLIHYLTNFNPNPGAIQTVEAVWGIRAQLALATTILMIFEAFIYLKWWDLTPDKTLTIKAKLKELNL